MAGRKTEGRKLSLVVPVLNEELAVPIFIEHLRPILETIVDMGMCTEIVFVDDGSSDSTVAAILDAPLPLADVRVVKLSRNFRKDNALTAGLAHTTGDAVVPIDVDLQDPPELILRMIEAWTGGAKIVNARRTSWINDGPVKRATSHAFYAVFEKISDYRIDANVGDFRLLDRQVVDLLNQMPERVRFMKGLFSWIGFNPVTLEYERPIREAGQTKWNFWKLWNFALDGITGSSTLPLRAWTYLGLALAFISVVYAMFLVLRTMIWGIDVPGYASLMVVTLLLGSFNLVALGILGEYIGRTNIEVRGRPVYVVEEVIDRPGTGPDQRSPSQDIAPPQAGDDIGSRITHRDWL